MFRRNANAERRVIRLYRVSPSNIELYALRVSLLTVPARSYADLRTVDGITYSTFHAATIARGLLKAGDEHFHAMREAIQFQATSAELRWFFAITVQWAGSINASAFLKNSLWQWHRTSISVPGKVNSRVVSKINS